MAWQDLSPRVLLEEGRAMGRKCQHLPAYSIHSLSWQLQLLLTTTSLFRPRGRVEFWFWSRKHFPSRTGRVWLVVHENHPFCSPPWCCQTPPVMVEGSFRPPTLKMSKIRKDVSTWLRTAPKSSLWGPYLSILDKMLGRIYLNKPCFGEQVRFYYPYFTEEVAGPKMKGLHDLPNR